MSACTRAAAVVNSRCTKILLIPYLDRHLVGARAVSTHFHWPDPALSRAGIPSPLPRPASLRTQHALRRFAHGDAPGSNLLDGRIAAAQPLGCAVARATVLPKGDIPNAPTAAFRCARLASARGAGRHPTNRYFRRRENMTYALCPITVRKALEKIPGVAETKVDFDRKLQR